MTQGFEQGLRGVLRRWIEYVVANARKVLTVAAVLALAAITLAVLRLSVDTDPANMLSAQLPWRQAEKALDAAFPNTDAGLVVVLDGPDAGATGEAQAELYTALLAQPHLFKAVHAAEMEPYFRKNGLLYLDQPALEEFSSAVLRAQPFLGALARDPSLTGVSDLLSQALQAPAGGFDLATPLKAFAGAVDAAARGEKAPLDWTKLMAAPGNLAPSSSKFIEVAPVLDYSRLQPAAAPIAGIRTAIAALKAKGYEKVRVRITGSKALEHEEIAMAFSGALLAFGVALILAAVLLMVALRSGRLVAATVISLLFGLTFTAGFAALAVGKLNLISMAFGVLYVGLGLDYALYVAMRYRELRQAGQLHAEAMPNAAVDVGGFLFVCAATTSLGFLAFVPTSFTGIAGLGLISGAGMFISLIVSLSILPALMTLMPSHAVAPAQTRPWLENLLEAPYRHAKPIWGLMLVLLAIAAYFAPRARFDFDPLHLRDPKSESVATFRDLLKDPSIPTLTLSAVAKDDAEARSLQAKLAKRPTVARVMTVMDLVPQEQEDKLATLEDLSFSMGPMLAGEGTVKVLAKPEDAAALDRLQDAMQQGATQWSGEQAKAAQALADALKRLQAGPDAEGRIEILRNNLLSGLPAQLSQLRELMGAQAVTEADLPAWLRARWRAVDGRPRVEVSPREILDDNAATARFVDDVRAAEPGVTGGPVGMIEAGRAVVASFKQAFLYSAIAITLLLIVLLRSVKDTVLVMIPLLCAGLFTMAASTLTHTPFNFANVIALPLLLGVGVDYGVYLVQQGRRLPANANLLKTGATRAVLFGALITIANFGDLMLARHPGMVSMGLLLTIGLAMILLCTLVLLPSLLARFAR